MKQYRIGVDLGGTNIVAGLVNEFHKILHKISIKTNVPRPAEEIGRDIGNLCYQLCRDTGIPFENVEQIGIGSPGTICNGIVRIAENLGFVNVPLAEIVADFTHKNVTLINDGNAAAYGEMIAGCGKGCHSLVAITLGTGVGGGIIVDGKILEGFNGAAGEIGHIIVKSGGNLCVCGCHGCLEAYCSATALIKATREAMCAHPESVLNRLVSSPDQVNGKTAFDGMRAGDSMSVAIVNTFINTLADGVASLIQLFQPETICIGGGISYEGDTLLIPLRKRVYELVYPGVFYEKTKIKIAELGNDAGIIGAAQWSNS